MIDAMMRSLHVEMFVALSFVTDGRYSWNMAFSCFAAIPRFPRSLGLRSDIIHKMACIVTYLDQILTINANSTNNIDSVGHVSAISDMHKLQTIQEYQSDVSNKQD